MAAGDLRSVPWQDQETWPQRMSPRALRFRRFETFRDSRSVFWPQRLQTLLVGEAERAGDADPGVIRTRVGTDGDFLESSHRGAGVERRPGLELGGPGRQLAVLGVLDPVSTRLEERGGHFAVV